MLSNRLKRPYIIIGMHRSGTSFLSRVLHENGIFMGYKQSPNAEARYFQKRNIQLMQSNGFSWDRPQIPKNTGTVSHSDFGLLFNFFGIHKNPGILKELWQKGSPGNWGFKDPRNTFTLPYWLQLFPDARVIHIYRNGMDVAVSLYTRNEKKAATNEKRDYSERLEDKLQGLDLWEEYTEQAIHYAPQLGRNMLTLRFESLIEGNVHEIERLEAFTSLSLKAHFANKADKERTARYLEPQHADLVEYANRNSLMKKLHYV